MKHKLGRKPKPEMLSQSGKALLLPLAQLLGALQVEERRRELAPRGLVAKVAVVRLGLRAERDGHLVARVDAAAVRVEVDRLRLHVPRGVEGLGGEHQVDLVAGPELL